MPFQPDLRWTTWEKNDPQRDTVEIFDEDEETRRYRSRKSTLDCELQTSNYFLRGVIFATSQAVENSTLLSLQHTDLFPAEFWPLVSKDLNGSFGCRYHEDAERGFVGYDTWSCFKIKQVDTAPKPITGIISYYWMQITLFVRWHSETHRVQLALFLNCPEKLKIRLQDRLLSSSMDKRDDPYAWHVTFAEEISQLYDHSIWSLRDLVRDVEKARSSDPNLHYEHDFPRLHDIARHIIHANETLDVARDTAESMMHGHEMLNTEHPDVSRNDPRSFRQVEWKLYSLSKDLSALKARAVSLNERLQNEINLAFNLVSQRNSQVSVSDNAMMKTVAVVSLLYLPGTFVSGLFGMNFFSNNNNNNNDSDADTPGLTMSANFWLYWAITVPLTIATVGVWAMWHYHARVIGALRRGWRRVSRGVWNGTY